MKSIRGEYQSYAENVVPLTAREEQKIETRRAFYAGAATIFNLLCTNAPFDTMTDDEIADYYKQINRELLDFNVAVANGRA